MTSQNGRCLAMAGGASEMEELEMRMDADGIMPVVVEVSNEDHQSRRVSKALKRLEFSAPGPQMKAPQKKSRLRKRDPARNPCDCTVADCPGCFLPCPKCKSSKCGVTCQVNRNWAYLNAVQTESVDVTKRPVNT